MNPAAAGYDEAACEVAGALSSPTHIRLAHCALSPIPASGWVVPKTLMGARSTPSPPRQAEPFTPMSIPSSSVLRSRHPRLDEARSLVVDNSTDWEGSSIEDTRDEVYMRRHLLYEHQERNASMRVYVQESPPGSRDVSGMEDGSRCLSTSSNHDLSQDLSGMVDLDTSVGLKTSSQDPSSCPPAAQLHISTEPSPHIGLKRRLLTAERGGVSAEKMREAGRVLSVMNAANRGNAACGVLSRVQHELPANGMCIEELADCMQRLRWGEGSGPSRVNALDENSVVSLQLDRP